MSISSISYFTYWNPSRRERREGPLEHLVLDYPNFLFDIGDGIKLIPPFPVFNELLMSGGDRGGMSPGATWNRLSITREEYQQVKTALLELDLRIIHETHPYAPKYIRVDEELEQNVMDLQLWRRAVIKKYLGVCWFQQFLNLESSYPLLYEDRKIAEIWIDSMSRQSNYWGRYQPDSQSTIIRKVSLLSEGLYIKDSWDNLSLITHMEVHEKNLLSFRTAFTELPAQLDPISLV